MKHTAVESIATLKTALALLKQEYATAAADPLSSNDYDSCASSLKYMIRSLQRIIKDAWVDQQVGLDTAAESGAKLSKTSVAALNQAVSIINSLIAKPDEGEAEAVPQDVKDAVEEQINAAIAAFEAQLAQLDAAHAANPPAATTAPVAEGEPRVSVGSSWIIAEDSAPDKGQYRMLVIKSGVSGNRVNYGSKQLAEAAPLLNNAPIYVNHPDGIHEGRPAPRNIAAKVGWWSNPEFVEGLDVGNGVKVDGIVATANILENSATPWLKGMIKECLDRGKPDLVGVSVVALGDFQMKRDPVNGSLFRETVRLNKFLSADIVAEPGAGGQVLSAESAGLDQELMDLEKMTLEQLRSLRPDLVTEAVEAEIAKRVAAEAAKTTPVTESVPAVTSGLTAEQIAAHNTVVAETNDILNGLKRRETKVKLSELLAKTRLPRTVHTMIAEQVGDQILDEATLQSMVDNAIRIADASAASIHRTSAVGLPAGAIIPFGHGQVRAEDSQLSPLEQIQAALDAFFGSKPMTAEGKELPKSAYPRIESFKEFYRSVTGDLMIEGIYDRRHSVIGDLIGVPVAEALPGATHIVGGGTITMPNLLGTSMNRRLVNIYRGQNLWWQPIVTKTDISNFKQQDRVRLHNFGSLTNRSVGTEEYTELDWNETDEDYTPTGYGNLVTVGRRGIINDDLRGIASIPTLLGQSAAFTINEYVSNLITQNSGTGQALNDTYNIYDATNHQGNLLALAMNRSAVLAARRVTMKMTNDAGKRIGFSLRHLLVPVDLEDTAYGLIRSTQVPESANNEPNILADPNVGLRSAIVVPQFTNTTRWYGFADPSEITSIEMGFLFGREDPEMFTQNGNSDQMPFNNDVMAYKIRHEYGGGFIDYRGTVGSIP